MAAVSLTTPLERLAEDLRATSYLVAEDDPMRPYLAMLADLPCDPAAWLEVLSPWLTDARHGRGPDVTDRRQLAALGALGVIAMRAARELRDEPELAAALRTAARWCFFHVRPDAH